MSSTYMLSLSLNSSFGQPSADRGPVQLPPAAPLKLTHIATEGKAGKPAAPREGDARHLLASCGQLFPNTPHHHHQGAASPSSREAGALPLSESAEMPCLEGGPCLCPISPGDRHSAHLSSQPPTGPAGFLPQVSAVCCCLFGSSLPA